ncbi:uncharacterized protein HKW66_Vig0203520 [Vigna angularis]|uniref:Uncharacterized protein n=1 Tax=Phaseolus angularis TaxID=3914 RepID=A0A8T0JVT4_PHAAN|nr:uncharacterized protein HKW66_Vig0203520 [Vigna angularis]
MESLITLVTENTVVKQVPCSIVSSKSIAYICLRRFEGLAKNIFPSIIGSWMPPTMNHQYYNSLVCMDMENYTWGDLAPLYRGLANLRSVLVQCNTKFQLYKEVKTILIEYLVNFTESRISSHHLRFSLIGFGSYNKLHSTLSDSISEPSPLPSRSHSYAQRVLPLHSRSCLPPPFVVAPAAWGSPPSIVAPPAIVAPPPIVAPPAVVAPPPLVAPPRIVTPPPVVAPVLAPPPVVVPMLAPPLYLHLHPSLQIRRSRSAAPDPPLQIRRSRSIAPDPSPAASSPPPRCRLCCRHAVLFWVFGSCFWSSFWIQRHWKHHFEIKSSTVNLVLGFVLDPKTFLLF